MGRVDHYPGRTLCWVELVTPDLEAAIAFYGALLGWAIQPHEGGADARIDGLEVAGLARADGGSAGWRTSVAVDDPAATSRRAAELGGSAAPGGGGPIRDPHGAALWLRPAGADAGARLVNEVGTWNWTELVTPDLDSSARFYGQLFGWSVDQTDAPIERRTFTMGDLLIAAAHLPQPGEPARAEWQVSFRVADARAAAARAEELGGRVLLPPIDIPIGALTIVADPAGAATTLTEFDRPFRGVDGS